MFFPKKREQTAGKKIFKNANAFISFAEFQANGLEQNEINFCTGAYRAKINRNFLKNMLAYF